MKASEFRGAGLALRTCLAVAALLGACGDPQGARIEQTRSRLAGTWLQEVDDAGEKTRVVLVLGTDGQFTARVARTPRGAPAELAEFAGEWSYDGTNLKRRFLAENGRAYADGAMRHSTLAVQSLTGSGFVGADNIERRRFEYRRVQEGTQP